MGYDPVAQTWKQLQNACHLKLTLRCMPFMLWWATTEGSSRGIHTLHSHLMNTWLGKGPAGSQSWCHYQKMPWRLLKHWNRCMTAPILAFAHYTKLFLLETDASKEGLEMVLLQKQADGQYHPVAYGSRALMPLEKNYHSTKCKFLALKWAVTKHSKEYLPYQPFLVKTDNNPLTNIMMTPNLDAAGHWWLSALVQLNFEFWNNGKDMITQCKMH